MRNYLKQGESLEIKNSGKTFLIDEVLGDGATCIVYSAHVADGMNNIHHYRIKECYPYNADIERENGFLIWRNNEEKESAIRKFKEAYERLISLQNQSNIGNSITDVMDIGEANNTIYQIINLKHGHSYDKDIETDLAKVFDVSLHLAQIVRELHRNNLLHLDIKPSNFLVSYAPSTNVYLFDVDTIAPTSDIKKYERVSYSEEYAAPEQLQNQRDKICPATDIYAIGSILFEKIMGRKVSNSDQGIFAKWDLEAKFENPKTRQIVREIFQRTLAANCKRRYSSIDELIDALNTLIQVHNTPHYLISSVPDALPNFVGRSNELAQINSAMRDSKVVFLSGDGGIGKSELIKQWLSLNKDSYSSVVYMRYTESIEKCIENITIKHVANPEEKYDYLKSLVDETDLLILDNFDITLDAESEWLDKLLDLKFKLIVVSRTNFESTYPQYHHLHIESMACDELVQIFNNESGHILTHVEENMLDEVFERGEECTYLVSMAAKLLKQGEYSIFEIANHFNSGLSSLEDADEIIDTKDGTRVRHSIVAAMSKLFRLFKLNEYQKSVLSAVYYLERLNIEGKELKRIIRSFVPNPTRYTTALSQLIELGHIQKNGDQLILHSILAEIVKHDLNPSIGDNSIITAFIDKELFGANNYEFDESFSEDTIYFDSLKNKFECFMSVCALSANKSEDYPYIVERIYALLGGNESNVDLINNPYAKCILSKIYEVTCSDTFNDVIRIKANIILETWHLSWSAPGWDEPSQKHMVEMEKAEQFFKNAKELVQNLQMPDENLIDALCRPFCEIRSTKWLNMVSPITIRTILILNPICDREKTFVLRKFSIRCLTNYSYQFEFLQEIQKKIESEHDEEMKRCMSYHACKKIFANGLLAATFTCEEHKTIFENVFSYSKDLFVPQYCSGQYLHYVEDDVDDAPTINSGIFAFLGRLNPDDIVEEDYIENLTSSKDKKLEFPANVPHSFYNTVYIKEHKDVNSIIFDYEELNKISDKACRFEALCGFMESISRFYHSFMFEEDENVTYSADQLKQLEQLSKDLIGIGEALLSNAQVKNDLNYYMFSEISEFEEIKRSFYRNALLLSITFEQSKLKFEYWNKLFEASKELMEILSEEDIVNLHETRPNSDTGMWGTLNRLQRYGYYDTALEYMQEYCDVIISHYGYKELDRNLYDIYKEIYECATAAANNCFKTAEERLLAVILLDDENPILKKHQAYRETARIYFKKINKINGTKYMPKD